MKPFFSKDVLATVSVEELQLIRRCISYRMTDWEEDEDFCRNNNTEPNPEDLEELNKMRVLYKEVTDILVLMPF